MDVYQRIPLDDDVFPEQEHNPVDMAIISSTWSVIWANILSRPRFDCTLHDHRIT
jgi:hypothetical protein